jgi:hypothetical protein
LVSPQKEFVACKFLLAVGARGPLEHGVFLEGYIEAAGDFASKPLTI